MRFEGLLARNVRGFWAASYSFGLKLFDQYLLRRLSQNPLNAVVLADQDKVADLWEGLPEGEHYLARQVGRRYLLRGLKAPGGGAFHPKTYLLARADGATLVVGSGNLTRDGIDYGREVFTSFRSEREQDLPSMRAWAGWMSRLVDREADELLRERWAALREACPWMLGPADRPMFLGNDERSMLEQLIEHLPGRVTELHVTAPFFDREALALRALLEACEPARTVLYLGAGVSVHGPSLASVLREAPDVQLKRFEPRNFVHAKLIGAVGSDGHGTLLMGSPNLSRAALTLTCAGGDAGNCETAVLRDGDGQQVRAVFESSGLELVELSLGALDELEFDEDHPGTARPLVLRSATWRADGRIAVERTGGAVTPEGTALAWGDGGEWVALDDAGATAERLDDREPRPLLAWLVDVDGTAISNRVAVDDPKALRETLVGSERKRGHRPEEMQGLEAVPLVRLVLWANDKFIFDLDKNDAFRRAQDAAGEEAGGEDPTGFWERYAREELQYDPRSHTYRPLTPGSGASEGPVDELLRDLRMLLHAAPGTSHPPILRLLTPGPNEGEVPDPKPGTPWTMEARQRVRAYNLLTRWCEAVADPRHMLISPEAPLVNYQTLLGVILAAWMYEALDREHLRRLLQKLLGAFIGAAEGRGFLGRVDAGERRAALAGLDPFTTEVAAGLAAAALESGWQHDIYDWQPVLRRGLEFDVLVPGQGSAQVVEWISGAPTAPADIAALLAQRIDWVDDQTWCERLADELGLESVSLDLHRNATVRAAAKVRGAGDPLHDVRLLAVARRALEFKHLPAIAVLCGRGAVLIFEPGKHARALIGGATSRSAEPVTVARLEEVERQGGSWADLLDLETSAAAA